MALEGVTGEQLKVLFEGGLSFLAEHQQEIDRLNVFPVPDGDTGRNMYLTMQAAVQELQRVKTCSLSVISEAVAKGSLMGARGNSGVILSQLIRGFTEAVKGSEEITLTQFDRAWQMAVSTAYQAVMKPVEGTILTVARGFSQGLDEAVKTASNLLEMLFFALQKGNETLQRTPDMLPVLKRAGVVDAGGKGLLVIFEGGLRALSEVRSQRGLTTFMISKYDGYNPASASAPAGAGTSSLPTSQLLDPIIDDEEEFAYTYEVELLLRGDPASPDQLRLTLQDYGGSIVVGNVDDVIRVHVHSNQPGQVLEHCLQFGTLHNIQVTNMRDQWEELHGGAKRPDVLSSAGTDDAVREIGVLAVAAGEGIEKIFRSLGAEQIVAGGQTMNPPVEEFIKAIESMSRGQVLVLPNNKNLIMAAEQAGKLVSRNVAVLPTTSIQAGISAMMAFNPSLDKTANIEKMKQAIGRVKAGEVTYAIRDAVLKDIAIKQGALIGLWKDDIVAVGASLEHVVLATVDRMLDGQDELVTLLTGKEALPEEADRIASLIRSSHPQIEVEVQYGGQPVYYFLISVE